MNEDKTRGRSEVREKWKEARNVNKKGSFYCWRKRQRRKERRKKSSYWRDRREKEANKQAVRRQRREKEGKKRRITNERRKKGNYRRRRENKNTKSRMSLLVCCWDRERVVEAVEALSVKCPHAACELLT